MLCKSIVSAIVCRHSHYSSCSISSKYVVRHPNRHFFTVHWIDSIGASKHTRYSFVYLTISFGTFFCSSYIVIHCSFLLSSSHHVDIVTFGSKYHERNSKDSICTSRKDGEINVRIFYFELHFCTYTFTYPVALCFFDRFAPVYCF